MRNNPADHRLVLAAALFVTAAWPSTAARREVTLTLDNDFFAGFERHYTNGFQAAMLAHTASLPGLIRGLHPFGAARSSPGR